MYLSDGDRVGKSLLNEWSLSFIRFFLVTLQLNLCHKLFPVIAFLQIKEKNIGPVILSHTPSYKNPGSNVWGYVWIGG